MATPNNKTANNKTPPPATPESGGAQVEKLVEEYKKQEEATWALANKGNTYMLKVDILKVHGLIREINPNPRSLSTSQVATNNSTDIQPPSKRAKKGPHQEWSIEVLPELKEEVEAMEEAWNNILEGGVSGREAERRPSPRKKSAPHNYYQPVLVDSQPDSQGSNASAASDFETPTPIKGARMMGDLFNAATTAKEALDFLRDNRKNGIDKFEENYTQWVVNRILGAALPAIQAIAKKNKKWLSKFPILQDKMDIGLYAETTDKRSQINRYPDSVIFLKGKGGDNKFNREVAGVGNLVSFEHKSDISDATKREDAILELKRDFIKKLNAVDILSPAVGYGVITDGIVWQFLRLRITNSESECDIFIDQSHDVDVVNIDNSYDFSELAEWLAFICRMSLVEAHAGMIDDGVAKSLRILTDTNTEFLVSEILAEDRYFVAKATANSGEKVVLKMPWSRKPRYKRICDERFNLMQMQTCDAVVNLVSGYDHLPFLVLEDVGIPLDKLVVSGEVGKELAKVVKRDILETALPALQAKSMVHADLHPGNICVQENNGMLFAKVVDLESAVHVGEKLELSPIKHRPDLVPNDDEKASLKMDQVMVAAILHCLWEVGSFQDLVKKAMGLNNEKSENKYQAEYKKIVEKVKGAATKDGQMT